MNIFTLARYFEIKKLAESNYPSAESVTPIVSRVVDSFRSNPLMKAVVRINQPVDVQVNMDAECYVYFQLIVKPAVYQQLINEPDRSQLINLLVPPATQALKAQYSAFQFHVKLGIVPE